MLIAHGVCGHTTYIMVMELLYMEYDPLCNVVMVTLYKQYTMFVAITSSSPQLESYMKLNGLHMHDYAHANGR